MMTRKSSKGPHFISCQRCSGHGYFFVPPQGRWPDVFSMLEARRQLLEFVQERLISVSQHVFLIEQIKASGLPETPSSGVKERIRTHSQAAAWTACYSQVGEERSHGVWIDSTEIAEAVHEYIIGLPEMRLQ